jgi:hypothetical protein
LAERSLGRGALLRLAKELSDELAVLDRVATTVLADADRLRMLSDAASPDVELGRGVAAVTALGLHRWYCALESIVERVERAFGTLPDGPEWHIELLQGATSEIPAVRPPLLPVERLDALRELLKFRHFLRHAYAVELDATRLLVLADTLAAARRDVCEGITGFVGVLRAMAEAMG